MEEIPKIGIRRRPKPSRATLTIPRKSDRNFVGQLTFGEEKGQGQCLGFIGLHEHDSALTMIYAPGVIDVEEQIKSIDYLGADGEVHKRTFDFRVTTVHGSRYAIDVKNRAVAETARYRDDVTRAAAAAIPGTADKVFIVSKRNFNPEELHLAKLFHVSRFPQPEIDRVLEAFIEGFSGHAAMRDMLNAAGIGDNGFHAVMRLIHKGILTVAGSKRITLSSVVAKGEGAR